MGKDWLYWVGGGGGGSGSSSSNSSSSSTTTKSCGGRSMKKGRLEGNHTQASSGCMSAVFQLFDFHHFQFPLHHHHQVPPFHPPSSHLPDKPITGVEAPRNSLEMEEPYTTSFPSSTMKGEQPFLIPMGIQVKTRTDDLSSEFSSSPSSKTPNLVARLMGLDILPPADTCSTSSSTCVPALKSSHPHMTSRIRSNSVGSRNFFDTEIIGTRSLPETPRISSARRSDVEYHHRLSLQINKENAGVADDLSTRRRDQILRQEDHDHQSISPGGRYARQIVKQVKEKVSRRAAGVDITNTVRNREIKGRRDDDNDDGDHDHVVLLKVKKPSKGCDRVENEFSISPRLRSHSPKLSSQMPLSASVNANAQPVRVPVKQKSQAAVSPIPLQDSDQKHKKIISASHDQSLLKKQATNSNVHRNYKQEEPFVRSSTNRANLLEKKSKKTPLSSELLLNTNVVPTLFPVKKDYPSSSSAVKLPQKTAHGSDTVSSSKNGPLLSSNTSQVTYCKQEANKQTPTVQDLITRFNNSNGAGAGGAAFHYIARILKRTGIDKNTPLSFAHWYSPSHPLNPCIFDHLEISFPIPTSTIAVTTTTTTTTISIDSLLNHRCNRKLVFQLVDEILVEISKPFYLNFKPWGSSSVPSNRSILGSELIEKICTKIDSFPSADCQVLEDIDALIENDLGGSELKGSTALEEEGEAIVEEIEEEIVESLVHEMAVGVLLFGMGARWGTRADLGHVGTRDGILFGGCGATFT